MTLGILGSEKKNGYMSESRRFDTAPAWLHWTITFINRIGFPIAVCIYLGYMQLNALPKVVEALNAVNSTLGEVKEVIKTNNQIMRGMDRWRERH